MCILDSHERGAYAFASADITYAYNWQWTQWAKEGQDMTIHSYEPEMNDPRAFGMSAWWLPHKLYGERNVAFEGLFQWKRRFNTVQKVTRSVLMVRGTVPYIIIADSAKKDDDEVHLYKWSMTTPNDVELESFDGQNAILRDKAKPNRRLLLRCLDASNGRVECAFEVFSNDAHMGNPVQTLGRVAFSKMCTDADFRVLLYPLPNAGSMLPQTSWVGNDFVLQVQTSSDDAHFVKFGTGSHGEITICMQLATSQN